MLELIVISTLNGVLFGMLLFLLSSGLTVIFSMMGVLNFAHASFYMLGAFFGYQLTRWIGFWPALVLAPLLVGAVGMAVERYGLRNTHKHGHVAELLLTFGLAFAIEEIVSMIWGKSPMDYRIPAALDFPAFTVFSTNYPAYKIFMLAVSVTIFVALLVVLKKTRVGLIVQAALTHPSMVGHLGHNVGRVFMVVFGVGSALAGLAGVFSDEGKDLVARGQRPRFRCLGFCLLRHVQSRSGSAFALARFVFVALAEPVLRRFGVPGPFSALAAISPTA